jgi:hypothetical protein
MITIISNFFYTVLANVFNSVYMILKNLFQFLKKIIQCSYRSDVFESQIVIHFFRATIYSILLFFLLTSFGMLINYMMK